MDRDGEKNTDWVGAGERDDRAREATDRVIVAVRQELQPILGDKTNQVVSRLRTAVEERESLDRRANGPRAHERHVSQDAVAVSQKIASLEAAIKVSDPVIHEYLVDARFPPVGELERVRVLLRGLIAPSAGGRPPNLRRRLILDELVLALHAADVPLVETGDGIAESAANVILRHLGDAVESVHDDVMAAIDRLTADLRSPIHQQ